MFYTPNPTHTCTHVCTYIHTHMYTYFTVPGTCNTYLNVCIPQATHDDQQR